MKGRACYEYGHGILGLVVDRRPVRSVELPVEADPILRPEAADELQRLAKSRGPLLLLGPAQSGGGHFIERLPRPHPEGDAAWEELRKGRERLGNHRGVIAEGGREHARADENSGGAGAEGAQPYQRKRRMSAGVPPGLEVVADPDRVESQALGEHGVLEELGGSELLRRRLVPEP